LKTSDNKLILKFIRKCKESRIVKTLQEKNKGRVLPTVVKQQGGTDDGGDTLSNDTEDRAQIDSSIYRNLYDRDGMADQWGEEGICQRLLGM
jgi:hypothetical protein